MKQGERLQKLLFQLSQYTSIVFFSTRTCAVDSSSKPLWSFVEGREDFRGNYISERIIVLRSTGRHVLENVDKITEIIEVGRHVISRSIAQEPKIDHKTVLDHLRTVGFKKKLDVWVSHQPTPKNMMDQISICKDLAKRNEIDSFLNWMVTGDEECVTCDNIVLKRSWSKRGEAAQMVAKPELTSRKVLLCIWRDSK
ncbi:putative DD34D transposase [Trichonephila clavipes]|uniref:Putative DD34D transposase n=1 Tax=Trichonephila clavipes TaxID=2585209 RepID=A0A8X6SVB0_TRICX|nr:putative DD34D transposase [Trichonephila clavipes]